MLLRRVIEHVRTQNWTAVAIDFGVVVVGVFVGLQVTNWNDERRERQLERVYLQRLHDEAKSGVDGFFGFVERALAPKYEAYRATVELLGDPDRDEALSPAQCEAIGNMHDFIAMPFQFPSLAEMAASGRLGIIRDDAFPEYFTARLTNAAAGLDLSYGDCDAQAMRADARFRNLFADTGSRYNGYYTMVIERETQAVKSLHARLDELLGITH